MTETKNCVVRKRVRFSWLFGLWRKT